jgi:hypothetical protein
MVAQLTDSDSPHPRNRPSARGTGAGTRRGVRFDQRPAPLRPAGTAWASPSPQLDATSQALRAVLRELERVETVEGRSAAWQRLMRRASRLADEVERLLVA